MGSSEEDEAKLTVLNSELDVDYTEIFDLEESPDSDARFSNSFNINVNEGMEGAYQVDVKVYSESGDLMNSRVAELEVNSCEDKNCIHSDGKGYWGKGM